MNTKEKRPQFATPSAITKIRKKSYCMSFKVIKLERFTNETSSQKYPERPSECIQPIGF